MTSKQVQQEERGSCWGNDVCTKYSGRGKMWTHRYKHTNKQVENTGKRIELTDLCIPRALLCI